jgi:excisionase family DNA binding protein
MPEPIRLPRLLTEAEAAEALGVSYDTMLRERKGGRISYTMIGGRVRYTEAHLAEYVENRTVRCRANQASNPEPSPDTGSAGGPTPTNGAEPGSIAEHDRRAAHRLAQATFGKPN